MSVMELTQHFSYVAHQGSLVVKSDATSVWQTWHVMALRLLRLDEESAEFLRKGGVSGDQYLAYLLNEVSEGRLSADATAAAVSWSVMMIIHRIALFITSTLYLFQKVLEVLKSAHIISVDQIKKNISEFLRKK